VFVECIGYPETVGYVRRIPRNIWVYRTLYVGAAPLPVEGSDR
jgi:soluble lytic murein transglycosylase-like protein